MVLMSAAALKLGGCSEREKGRRVLTGIPKTLGFLCSDMVNDIHVSIKREERWRGDGVGVDRMSVERKKDGRRKENLKSKVVKTFGLAYFSELSINPNNFRSSLVKLRVNE